MLISFLGEITRSVGMSVNLMSTGGHTTPKRESMSRSAMTAAILGLDGLLGLGLQLTLVGEQLLEELVRHRACLRARAAGPEAA